MKPVVYSNAAYRKRRKLFTQHLQGFTSGLHCNKVASPCERFHLVVTPLEKGTDRYCVAEIQEVATQAILLTVYRNSGYFPFAWVDTQKAQPGIMFCEDIYGYCYFQLNTRKYLMHFPEEGFVGTAFSPENISVVPKSPYVVMTGVLEGKKVLQVLSAVDRLSLPYKVVYESPFPYEGFLGWEGRALRVYDYVYYRKTDGLPLTEIPGYKNIQLRPETFDRYVQLGTPLDVGEILTKRGITI